MIDIKDKTKCSGCSACAHSCPLKCITMEKDKSGFTYPKVDKIKCVDCKLCEEVCPIGKDVVVNEKESDAYAVINKNTHIRKESTSGGAFTAIAERVIDLGGVCFGATFSPIFEVVHDYVETKEDLCKIRGSKYVQSSIGNTYAKAKSFLENGRLVLFSGTGCQIAGLKAFLKKDYDNLLTVDVICHGVPSPLLWDKYINWQQGRYKSKITSVEFRSKLKGWKDPFVKVTFENEKVYEAQQKKDPMSLLFLRDICLRPACYDCYFKSPNKVSDVTLADFWGVEIVAPEIDDEGGTSLIILNSNKGEKIFTDIENKLTYKKVDLKKAVEHNAAYTKSSEKPSNYEKFVSDLEDKPFKYLNNKYCKDSLLIKVKKILHKIKLVIIRRTK